MACDITSEFAMHGAPGASLRPTVLLHPLDVIIVLDDLMPVLALGWRVHEVLIIFWRESMHVVMIAILKTNSHFPVHGVVLLPIDMT